MRHRRQRTALRWHRAAHHLVLQVFLVPFFEVVTRIVALPLHMPLLVLGSQQLHALLT